MLFASFADDLLPGTRVPNRQAYVLDRPTGQMLLVAVNTNGQPSHRVPDARELSADGRLVLFLREATDLAPDDTNNAPDAFVRDLQTGLTELVSRSPATGRTPVGGVSSATLSANGRTVIYAFTDRNHFVPALSGLAPFHALRDRVTGTHRPVGTNFSQPPALALSGDG
ncbi:MAG TPA: hypothetical protein PKE47_17220, partial [Verrucomicrobiota bacterium]|nr:hypothetical protein [Verrucomicrobiota bacterium]